MDEYLTVAEECRHTIEINRSVFICSLKGIRRFQEAHDYKKQIAKMYGDASHHCYAARMTDGRQKFFDDGEPGGTAGVPILQALKNSGLFNAVAVVTRYFGGVKLGAGGLISAYSAAATETIKQARIVTMIKSVRGSLLIEYGMLNDIMTLLRRPEYRIMDTLYGDSVSISFICAESARHRTDDALAEVTSGAVKAVWTDDGYYCY